MVKLRLAAAMAIGLVVIVLVLVANTVMQGLITDNATFILAKTIGWGETREIVLDVERRLDRHQQKVHTFVRELRLSPDFTTSPKDSTNNFNTTPTSFLEFLKDSRKENQLALHPSMESWSGGVGLALIRPPVVNRSDPSQPVFTYNSTGSGATPFLLPFSSTDLVAYYPNTLKNGAKEFHAALQDQEVTAYRHFHAGGSRDAVDNYYSYEGLSTRNISERKKQEDFCNTSATGAVHFLYSIPSFMKDYQQLSFGGNALDPLGKANNATWDHVLLWTSSDGNRYYYTRYSVNFVSPQGDNVTVVAWPHLGFDHRRGDGREKELAPGYDFLPKNPIDGRVPDAGVPKGVAFLIDQFGRIITTNDESLNRVLGDRLSSFDRDAIFIDDVNADEFKGSTFPEEALRRVFDLVYSSKLKGENPVFSQPVDGRVKFFSGHFIKNYYYLGQPLKVRSSDLKLAIVWYIDRHSLVSDWIILGYFAATLLATIILAILVGIVHVSLQRPLRALDRAMEALAFLDMRVVNFTYHEEMRELREFQNGGFPPPQDSDAHDGGGYFSTGGGVEPVDSPENPTGTHAEIMEQGKRMTRDEVISILTNLEAPHTVSEVQSLIDSFFWLQYTLATCIPYLPTTGAQGHEPTISPQPTTASGARSRIDGTMSESGLSINPLNQQGTMWAAKTSTGGGGGGGAKSSSQVEDLTLADVSDSNSQQQHLTPSSSSKGGGHKHLPSSISSPSSHKVVPGSPSGSQQSRAVSSVKTYNSSLLKRQHSALNPIWRNSTSEAASSRVGHITNRELGFYESIVVVHIKLHWVHVWDQLPGISSEHQDALLDHFNLQVSANALTFKGTVFDQSLGTCQVVWAKQVHQEKKSCEFVHAVMTAMDKEIKLIAQSLLPAEEYEHRFAKGLKPVSSTSQSLPVNSHNQTSSSTSGTGGFGNNSLSSFNQGSHPSTTATSSKPLLRFPMITAGIAGGPGLVGVTGTQIKKRFCCESDAVVDAEVLSSVALDLFSPVIVSPSIEHLAKIFAVFRAVEIVDFSMHTALAHSVVGGAASGYRVSGRQRVYETTGIRPSQSETEEWMYALKRQEAGDQRTLAADETVACLERGDFSHYRAILCKAIVNHIFEITDGAVGAAPPNAGKDKATTLDQVTSILQSKKSSARSTGTSGPSSGKTEPQDLVSHGITPDYLIQDKYLALKQRCLGLPTAYSLLHAGLHVGSSTSDFDAFLQKSATGAGSGVGRGTAEKPRGAGKVLNNSSNLSTPETPKSNPVTPAARNPAGVATPLSAPAEGGKSKDSNVPLVFNLNSLATSTSAGEQEANIPETAAYFKEVAEKKRTYVRGTTPLACSRFPFEVAILGNLGEETDAAEREDYE